ncbi:putative oxidoreductase [Colletotrichum orbiculare MAFF 240422]|uniref:Oxidoreductase n=1 Tax=Colletotrichum orbiculare (strain 104-T / ATCC 96160 / CBS 514.97 / LARS 414 / MAFF 240422) TaxID=1213857 RepID=A0A484G2K0_COLOR|nr:putative oxidoreductase [Colletotrichum orbiculare MAFF 240422]
MATSKPVYSLPDDAVWFITGCSSGIGQALAQIVASHQTQRLVATARSVSKLRSFLPDDDPRILLTELDVNSSKSIRDAFDAAVAKFGRVDVVANVAGFGTMGDTESFVAKEEDMEKARGVMETNFWGTAQVSAHAVRVFRDVNPASGQIGGVVLNVTSIGGYAAFPGSSFYHASKFAVEGFTESLSKETRPEWNIHFCIVEPGGTKTNFATGGMAWLSPHPAYSAPDTPSRLLEGYVKSPEMQETWVPSENVAAAMYEIVARKRAIPQRFPTGVPAWTVIKAKSEEVGKGLDEIKDLCFSVDDGVVNKSGEFLGKTF